MSDLRTLLASLRSALVAPPPPPEETLIVPELVVGVSAGVGLGQVQARLDQLRKRRRS
jgi:hypothetical protein